MHDPWSEFESTLYEARGQGGKGVGGAGTRGPARAPSPAISSVFPVDEIDREVDDDVLFARITRRDHDGQRNQGIVRDALVPVHEGVVLRQEVQKVGSFSLEARIQVPAAEGLHDGSERTLEAVVLLAAEEVRTAELRAQALYGIQRFLVGNPGRRPIPHLNCSNSLVIRVVQQIQGVGVIGHDGKQYAGLVAGYIESLHHVLDQFQGLPQLPQTAFVGSIALDEVILEDAGGPDPELCATLAVDPVADRDDHIEIVESAWSVRSSNVHFLHIAFFI